MRLVICAEDIIQHNCVKNKCALYSCHPQNPVERQLDTISERSSAGSMALCDPPRQGGETPPISDFQAEN